MLLQFKFKNHKCFYDEAILDLTATQEKGHNDTLIDINRNEILPIIEINGANASGKSSVLEALYFMITTIKMSSKFDISKDLITNPFAFDNTSKNKNSEYEISILIDGYEYRYGFSMNKKEFEEEWLYKKKFDNVKKYAQKIIFERNKNKVEFGSSYTKYKKTWELFVSNIELKKSLILSIVSIKEPDGILRDIYEYINNINFKIENIFKKQISIQILNQNSSLYNKFQNIIREFDPCLYGIKVEKSSEDPEDKSYKLSGIHKNVDDNSKNFLIPLENESAGTIKMFNILPEVLKNLEQGGLLCIDELDTKLHPLLFKRIVDLYKDRETNKNNAQLIYTAHSTFLFDSDELRRDELYLVEKDLSGRSNLYSLSEFRNLRSDADYRKKYLTGQLGAIPYNNKR